MTKIKWPNQPTKWCCTEKKSGLTLDFFEKGGHGPIQSKKEQFLPPAQVTDWFSLIVSYLTSKVMIHTSQFCWKNLLANHHYMLGDKKIIIM